MPPDQRRSGLELPENLRALFTGDPFDSVMRLQGEVYRDVPGRKTIRVHLGGGAYFIKQHFGVGWAELLKNLTSFRLPVFDASTELQAIRRFGEIGIPTTPVVAFGRRGFNPVTRQSFLITRDLGDIVSLEDFCRDWAASPPPPGLKRRIIEEIARIARTLHAHGMHHRDFYLCHFCLDREALAQGRVLLYLIDLHRVGMQKNLSVTARMKDLAALYFSVMDLGLVARDYRRFIRHYRGRSVAAETAQEQQLWRSVAGRAGRLYLKYQQRGPR
ncbi:MAG: lipopolysaccharide core heptose(I) kinase RfaP [Methylobacterium sp.]|nr:lipopolysaccharide core heptose(I) kinase RfaP [Methylobacterium sp.]